MSYGLHFIDCLIWSSDLHKRWRTTFVYGEPRAQDRRNMWDLLRWLKSNSQEPWLMLGDFNEVLWDFEHFSARHRPERQMVDFREILSHCDLHDLGFSRFPWTYDNKQRGESNVQVRLDHVVASPDWKQIFPSAHVQHLVSPRSDHCPILIEVEKEQNSKPPCIFRYEIMWEREDSL
jgi:endonuclease/exonuclease/phosphatase family metal-dependent hydrolase